MKVNKQHDMTEGKIFSPLVGFTIPLVLGNLFQLAYNAADSIIVGQLLGEDSLAAVGTSTPVMNIAILLISGMCMGASILMSSEYGAEDYGLLKRQISTTMLGGIMFSLIFSLIMMLLAHPVLSLIQVPQEIIPQAGEYLRIVFLGLAFTFIYNFFANTMRALGDSKTPLYFLMTSAVLNIIGDIILIAVFEMGVAGSAVSTVLSEALCCLMCGVYIRKKIPLLCLGKEWFVFDRDILKKTVSYGSTSAMQQVCLQIGKVMVQAMVNARGVGFMAAFTAVNRVDDFAYIPQQNIGHAMTTFIAQNKGAGKQERIRKGFQCGMLIEFIYSLCLFVIILFGAEFIMKTFVDGNEQYVIHLGVDYLRTISIIYLLPGITNGIQGFFRGIGDLKVTLKSTFMNMLGRVVGVFVILALIKGSFTGLVWGNVAGWILMLLFEVPLLRKELKILKKKNTK